MDKENLKISVIICAYTTKRLHDICEAVDSVLAQTQKPDEIIISVDHNKELFQKLSAELPSEVKIILNQGAQGLSETRNVGVRESTGDIIAFLDDDAVAAGEWLEKLTRHFHESRVVAVGGKAVPAWTNGKRPAWFPEELDWIVGCIYKGLPINGDEVRNVIGCNMAFVKEVFNKVGYFNSSMGGINETPRGGEETDLCLRIKSQMSGARILYEADAIIHHKVPSWRLNLRYLSQRSYNEGYYKSKVQKLSPQSSLKPLSTEESYLRYLLFTAIPERLKNFYQKGSLLQLGTIILCLAVTGLGYIIGRVLWRAG